ncbi:CMP-N-acetylneuraminate-beta-galactosamide-alpha-2,3-sialyltransferase 4 isoform X2 [Leuresthes tenuis]|uniref:CMP-N-acetylneuraminate-beta-galactosamide- alpha-2,3-sialyltransferase 4 isoform X2 n=1 Tax=Leuresthes tenuis TaxID=355514 RepID=UPI003B5084D4
MSQKATKTWCLMLVPVVIIVSCVTYYCSYIILQSSGGTNKFLNSSKSQCGGWLTQKKWESLNFNISRQTQLFLKMKDFFWRDHQSKQTLPYGIKDSELLLLKVLAVTSNYQMPAKLENRECRTCVVIGNGFVIKNSYLGSAINKYDVVIRLNNAPVRGYEEDVGNKTTLRFFYPESASDNPGLHNEPGTLMVLVPFKQQDLRWVKEIVYDEKRVQDMSGKAFGSLLPKSGWVTSTRSECWTHTFCTRLQRNCSISLFTRRGNRILCILPRVSWLSLLRSTTVTWFTWPDLDTLIQRTRSSPSIIMDTRL